MTEPDNSTPDDLKDIMGGIGGVFQGLGDTFRERDAQRAAGTHDWVKQPDGTQKWLPIGSGSNASTQPAADNAPPQGMPRPRIKLNHRGSAPEQPSAGARPMLSIHAKNAGRPTLPLNTESDPAPPQGMERPKLKLKTQTED
jgi:hypothetical protein